MRWVCIWATFGIQTTPLRQCLCLSTDARMLSSSSTTTRCQRHNYRNCGKQWEPKVLFVQCLLTGAPFSRCTRPSWVQVSSAHNCKYQKLCERFVCSKGWMQKVQGVIWIMCVGLLLSMRECMSVIRLTIPVSCHKVRCQSYLVFMHYICLYKVEIIPDTNYGQTCETDSYLYRHFWQVWIRQEYHNNFSFMLSLFKSNWAVSVCMPNNLGYQQDQIRRPSATTTLSRTWR